MNGPAKNYDFGGCMFHYMSFKMTLESSKSEICEKSYGRFTNAMQIGPKNNTLVFQSYFGNPTVGITFYVANESFWDFLIFSYWGFKSSFGVQNESYEFLK